MQRLGKYELVAEIARGGMGIVYLAVAQGPARFSKLHVVKALKQELVEDQNFLEMFLEEARLAARLNHPNIVQTYEIGADAGHHYIVMDYLDGVPLARILRRKNAAFTREMHFRVICEMLRGLDYAHKLKDFDGTALGIVHRDVTPQNVFVTYDGQVKLVDFGIAKAQDSHIQTRTGILKGKPGYMAPEQITGEVDCRADVFAVGVMVWEAVAGRSLWHKKNDVAVLTSVLKGEIPLLAEAVPDAPPDLIAICNKAMAPDRENRYESASALREALEEHIARVAPTTSTDDVAKVIGTMFEEERGNVLKVIESHLAQLKTGRVDGRIPSLPPPSDTTPSNQERPPTTGPSQTSGVSQAGTPGGAEIAALGAPPSRRKTGLIIGAVGVLLLLAVGLGTQLKGSRNEPSAASAVHEPSGGANARPVVDVPSSSAAGGSPGAASPGAPAVAAKDSAAVDVASPKPAADATRPAAGPAPAVARWTPRATAPAPAPATPSKKEKDPDPAPTPAPEASNPSRSTGYLTIDTYPWTRVSENGRVLGDTPLVKVALPEGSHTLTLENPTEHVRQTTVVVIKSGETISRRLAF